MLYFFILLVIGFWDCLGFFGMICVAIGLVGTGYQWVKDYKDSNL
jgi:hypothetical protein